MTPDPALPAALAAQAEALVPLAHALRAATVHPVIAPRDWGGPAARGYAALEESVRHAMAVAEQQVSTLLHDTRLAIGALHG
jgi:hypothetical protein